jgi:CRP-like cAMP-binding protein
MRLRATILSSLVLAGLIVGPPSFAAQEARQGQVAVSEVALARQLPAAEFNITFAKLLSDHPGSATALTTQQQREIRAVVARSAGNSHLVCTGVSLSGQRASMYRVVRLRAQLVCDYAKSLNPSLRTVVQESFTPSGRFNGRVVVVSR